MLNIAFIAESILLGLGMSMDAFSISIADGLSHQKMTKKNIIFIASCFGLFQAVMPLIGRTIVYHLYRLSDLDKYTSIIAFILLCLIGFKMIKEGLTGKEEKEIKELEENIGYKTLLLQGLATSLDALSLGFMVVEYSLPKAIISCLIIGLITFIICISGLVFGRKFSAKFADQATISGGLILIIIGIEMLIKGIG